MRQYYQNNTICQEERFDPISHLKAVFYIPSLQDIHIMLFFQFISFLSKSFNVLIFLLQL